MLESVCVNVGISILLFTLLTFCILVISREVAFVVVGSSVFWLALLFSSSGSYIFRLALFLFICIICCWLGAGALGASVLGCRGVGAAW